MSPTPIREALKLLESDGLVDYEPNKGVVVSLFAEHSLTDVLELRLALEPLATGLAAERRTVDDLAQIVEVHQRMVRAGTTDAPVVPELARLNRAFHGAIFHSAHSPALEYFVLRLWRNFPIRLNSAGRAGRLVRGAREDRGPDQERRPAGRCGSDALPHHLSPDRRSAGGEQMTGETILSLHGTRTEPIRG